MTGQSRPDEVAIGKAVLTLPQEIDIANADEVAWELTAAIQRSVPAIIADMSGTTFCDSSGIAVLVRAHRQAATEGADLRLVCTAQPVLRALSLTGADQVLTVYPTLDQAMGADPAASR